MPDLSLVDGGDDVLQFSNSELPEKPDFVDQEASDCWDVFVRELLPTDRLKPEYLPLLRATCEMYGLYRASYIAAQRNPTDKDCRIAATSYFSQYERGAARFGLNPIDIARIKSITKQKTGVRRRQA